MMAKLAFGQSGRLFFQAAMHKIWAGFARNSHAGYTFGAMITILITEDEEKTKEALTRMLKQEGYALSSGNTGDVIRLVKKDCIRDLAFIKDKVIELENSLFIEKKGVLYKSVLDAVEKPLLEQTLERCEGNQLKAARILGINRNTMRAKIARLGIDVTRWKTNL